MDINAVGTVSEDHGIFVHFKDVEGELLYDTDGGTKTPVGARVAGTFSERHRKATKRQKDHTLRAMRRGHDFDADAADDGTVAVEAACIIEWTFTASGQPFPITAENWGALIGKQPQWQGQVQAAMNDHASFFTAS